MSAVLGMQANGDVLVASDRLRSEWDYKTGHTVPIPGSKVIKSIRVNDKVCIACGGLTTLANQLYARLFGRRDWEGYQPDLDVAQLFHDEPIEYPDCAPEDILDQLSILMAAAPSQIQGRYQDQFQVLFAGHIGNAPRLFAWAKDTNWEQRETPLAKAIPPECNADSRLCVILRTETDAPETRLRKAIGHCSSTSSVVGVEMILQRLSKQFAYEEMTAITPTPQT